MCIDRPTAANIIFGMSVQEIEVAITRLKNSELSELVSWLDNYHADAWDRQIEADLNAGRLDGVLEAVDRQIAAGHGKPL